MKKKELEKLGRKLSGKGYVFHPIILTLWNDDEELPEYAKDLVIQKLEPPKPHIIYMSAEGKKLWNKALGEYFDNNK